MSLLDGFIIGNNDDSVKNLEGEQIWSFTGTENYHQSKTKMFAYMSVCNYWKTVMNLGKNLLGSSKISLQNWKITVMKLNVFTTTCLFFVVNRFAYDHCGGSIH